MENKENCNNCVYCQNENYCIRKKKTLSNLVPCLHYTDTLENQKNDIAINQIADYIIKELKGKEKI